MATADPIQRTLWGALNSAILTARFLGLLQTAKLIAQSLPGTTTLDKLAAFELGQDNLRVFPGKLTGTQLVVLKHCSFESLLADLPAWTPEALQFVANYNRNPGQGGAVYPLCVVHHGVRDHMPDPVVNLAARHAVTGEIVMADKNLRRVGLEPHEVAALLADHACLYCIAPRRARIPPSKRILQSESQRGTDG